jgi:hypothetical protein
MRTILLFATVILGVSALQAIWGASPLVTVNPDGADQFMPEQPRIPARTFNLDDYGAVADRTTLNTEAFRRAIAAVDQAGGGTLIVPAGIYLTGRIELCSGINLHLEAGATIVFAPPEKLQYDSWSLPPLLEAKGAHDVEISGPGAINGGGEAWWPAVHQSMHHNGPRTARPHTVVFDSCARVRV